MRNHMTIVSRNEGVAHSEHPSARLVAIRENESVRTIYVTAMDNVHGSNLVRTMKNSKPRYVIDMRLAMRFDSPGMNRGIFFDLIEITGSEYIRIRSMGSAEKDMLDDVLRYSRVSNGDIVLLMPKRTDVFRIIDALGNLMSKIKDRSWVMNSML